MRHLRFVLLCSPLLLVFTPFQLPAQIFPWTYEEIVADMNESGAKPDLFVDAQGTFHLSYWHAERDQLLYGYRFAGEADFTFEQVPDEGTFGYVSAVIADANGVVHLAYHHNDNGRAKLSYARRSATGDWLVQRLRDTIDVGLYGADLAYPSYIWPSIDVFLQPDGSPGILYFDGIIGNVQLCPVSTTRFIYFDYELDLHSLALVGDDWVDAPLPNIPFQGNVNCVNRGERFGEFCQMLRQADSSYLTLVPGMHNHEMLLFRSEGTDLSNWSVFVVDSVLRYMSNPSFFESFSYQDVFLQDNRYLHAVYAVTEHYGFENRDNRGNRDALIYTRIDLDSIGQTGYQPYRYVFPGVNQPRFYPTLDILDDSTVAVTYYQRSSEHLIQEVSRDSGQTWLLPDTLGQLTTNTPLQSALWQDSLYVLVYDAAGNNIRQFARHRDSLSDWYRKDVTNSTNSGNPLSSVVRRNGGDDEVYVLYQETSQDQLWLSKRIGGNWSQETVLPAGTSAQALQLALGATGSLHMTMISQNDNRLSYGAYDGSNWTISQIPDTNRATQMSMQAEGDDVYLAYYDPQGGMLRFSELDNGTWSFSIIDSSGIFVGQNPSLWLDQSGGLHVAYLDAGAVRIKYAWQTGGTWQTAFVTESQTFIPNEIDLKLSRDVEPQPIIAFKDGISDSIRIAEPGLDGVSGEWVYTNLNAPQASLSGVPLRMVLDYRSRPWIMYNYATSLRELRLARRGSDNQWYQASVQSNDAQIADVFDFHLVGQDFYLIGRQNDPNNPGVGLLYAQGGLTTLLPTPMADLSLVAAPNPTTGLIHLRWSQQQLGAITLQLLDIQGRTLQTQTGEAHMPGIQEQSMSLGRYPAGLYLLKLQTPEGNASLRIVKHE